DLDLNQDAKITSWNDKQRQSISQDHGHMNLLLFQVAIVASYSIRTQYIEIKPLT
ncbi:hypothetical protein BpHYR1_050533, partial [Brachionus plicatilis]